MRKVACLGSQGDGRQGGMLRMILGVFKGGPAALPLPAPVASALTLPLPAASPVQARPAVRPAVLLHLAGAVRGGWALALLLLLSWRLACLCTLACPSVWPSGVSQRRRPAHNLQAAACFEAWQLGLEKHCS